jgi:DNA recombination protein RmuC
LQTDPTLIDVGANEKVLLATPTMLIGLLRTIAVGSYNKSVGAPESRVLVTARKLVDLKAAPEGLEIKTPAPVDTLPRALQAQELVAREAPLLSVLDKSRGSLASDDFCGVQRSQRRCL